MLAKKGLMTSPSAVALYVEDVFSTYLYTGNGSTQTITNNIDLSGEGGLVWLKERSPNTTAHKLYDTSRGTSVALSTNNTDGNSSSDAGVTAFNADGFSLSNNNNTSNVNNSTYASWTFRKAEKFFDVVTYTGDGSARTINHNLGSTPGCIIVKRTDTTGNWYVYHRSNTANPETDYLLLNSTAATADLDTVWNDTAPTSTVFSVGTNSGVNANSGTYVAYLFAHDAGGFGDAGDQNVVSCGSFTTDGSGIATVTLGYEPQWLMFKPASTTGSWRLLDNMRGIPTGGNDAFLFANLSSAESSGSDLADLNATGFSVKGLSASVDFVYIAIRRGPMKTPESATSVFDVDTYTGNDGVSRLITTGFTTDMSIIRDRNSGTEAYRYNYLQDRLRAGGNSLATNANSYEASDTGWDNTDMRDQFRSNTGILVTVKSSRYNANSASYVTYNFARAPGFFDIVAYTGTGANATITHNLGVAPELIITKRRLSSANWATYNSTIGNTKYLVLNENDAATTDTTFWNSTSPTSTTFSLGSAAMPNQSTQAYIAYLFATLPGISKVGTYTGTATTNQINCGFTSGARFVMIKRTDTTGAWYIWDTARGIITGNDPYIFANGLDTEVTNTDYIDPYTSGFEISSTAPDAINAIGGTFIYLAIA